MAIPLKYNFRSMLLRKVSTIMTALSIALVVFIFVSVMALAGGLETALVSSGEPLNVLVLRRGSGSELSSSVPRSALQVIKYLPGIKMDAGGEPQVSAEVFAIINLPKDGEGQIANIAIRGVSPAGIDLRPRLRIVDGRIFQQGLREVIVSRTVSQRFPKAALGNTLRLGKADWKVVGIFEAGNTSFDSEIWADVNQVADDFNYQAYSSVLLQATDHNSLEAISRRVESDRSYNLAAQEEREFYERQTWAAAPIKALGFFIAIVMGIGACFAAMNAMYSAVSYRTKEIATLRVLGFKRRSILVSFLVESMLVALVGGVLGSLLTLPINTLTTGTTNLQTFSELAFAFRTSPLLLTVGLGFAALIGLMGGIFPARQASRQTPAAALRKT
jgi:putative ABC transport system permease protein